MKSSPHLSHKRQARWMLPEPSGWTCGPLGAAGRIAVPTPAQEVADGVVWPLSVLVGLPVWLAGEDPNLFPAAAALEWEKRGLLPRHYHSQSLVVREVLREGGRMLALPLALARQARAEEIPLEAEHYVSLLDALKWPTDAVVFFRERGNWAAVVTRGPHPVHFSIFHGEELPVHAGLDLACVLQVLQREGMMEAVQSVVLWDTVGPLVQMELQQALDLPVTVATRPPWLPHAQAPALLHPAVVVQRQRRQQLKSLRRVILAVGVVVAGLIAWAGGRAAAVEWEVRGLAAELKALESQVAPVRSTAMRWKQIEASIDPGHFPLEHLRMVAEKLPAQGVRLTEFVWKDREIRVSGEAQDTTMAFAFAERLQEHDAFAWELEPPSIQPNNSAQFVVKGRVGP